MCDHMQMQAEIIRHAIHVFKGDGDKAMRWLSTPMQELDGETPWSRAQYAEGFNQVKIISASL